MAGTNRGSRDGFDGDRTRASSPASLLETALVERSAVIAALDAIIDPVSGQGLVAAGLVQGLVVAEDRAGFALEVDRS
ncbi:iron-sulfur cluster assembly protein, partial [Escherichia coli]|uniref:iron-sulfur cluster assembly protein n=1 Tax=Escherichia coli TaxID=562 RepID=UPI003D7C347C